MKIHLLSALFAALCFQTTNAQQTWTYRALVGGSPTNTRSVDLVEVGNGNVCMLSTNPVPYSPFGMMMLRKTDPMGAVIFESVRTYYNIEPTKLIHTINDEYIIVGFHAQATPGFPGVFKKQPFAAKFGVGGAFQWMQVYPVNSTWMSNHDLDRVNIVYCADSPGRESYIMTYPADQLYYTPFGQGNNQDICIGALRLDASTGSAIWAKKYYVDQNDRVPEWVRADAPHALAYGDNNGNPKYFIGGPTFKSGTGMGLYFTNFFMTINIDGAIIDDYRNFDITGMHFNHDAIYDAGTNEFVMVLTVGAGAQPTASMFDIMKIDAASCNVNSNDYYYDADAVENYAYSICENPAQDAYLVGGMISGSQGGFAHTAMAGAILKVDEVTTVPIFLKRYNTQRQHLPSAVTAYINPNTTAENYALATTPEDVTAGVATYNTRVIAIDGVNTMCGELDRGVPAYGPQQYFVYPPNVYIIDDTPAETGVTPLYSDLSHNNWICIFPGDTHKSTSVSNMSNNATFKVYPTLLNTGSNTVNFEVAADAGTEFVVIATSVDGRTAGTYKTKIAAGHNKFSWELPVLVPGNYILNITSTDHSIRRTERISKL